MEKEKKMIHGIPSIIWGRNSNNVVIITHGSQSHKEDRFIQCCADILCDKGYQIISFDLPEHGERRNQLPIHTVKQAIEDMQVIMNYAKEHYNSIITIGCSLGAYYTLLAYQDESITQCLLLSPVVDLIELTHEMLENDNRTIRDVFYNKQVTLSNGIIVREEDYTYLSNHSIKTWKCPLSILYGMKDNLIKFESIQKFVSQYNCKLVLSDESAHYFHTKEDMNMIKVWLNQIE